MNVDLLILLRSTVALAITGFGLTPLVCQIFHLSKDHIRIDRQTMQARLGKTLTKAGASGTRFLLQFGEEAAQAYGKQP